MRNVRTIIWASSVCCSAVSPGMAAVRETGPIGCDNAAMTFDRITVRPEQMGGVPTIRGLRIPVATVVGMVADGMNEAEILAAYPDLEAADVEQALRFAAEAVRERELPLAAG